MQEVGYAGGEDEAMWGSIGGVGVSEGRRRGRRGDVHHHRPQNPPKPSRNPPPAQPPPRRRESFLLSRPTRLTTERSPGPRSPTPPSPPPPPHGLGRLSPPPNPQTPQKPPPSTPPPPPAKTDTPKGAEKKDVCPEDPIVGTVFHVPYPTEIERGTVRGIHRRKYGAVWAEYPGGTTLCEVARPLLFPTLEEAERQREEAWAGKKKAKPPTPTNEESNPPNANPTIEPTNPPNRTNPTNPPSGPAKMWDPTTRSDDV